MSPQGGLSCCRHNVEAIKQDVVFMPSGLNFERTKIDTWVFKLMHEPISSDGGLISNR